MEMFSHFKEFVIKNFHNVFSSEELESMIIVHCYENIPKYDKIISGKTNIREFFVCQSNIGKGLFITFGHLADVQKVLETS